MSLVRDQLQSYFGGAPRFDSASTFLGRKAEGALAASQPMTAETRYRMVLGKSDRYGANAAIPEGTSPWGQPQNMEDTRKVVSELVGGQAKAATDLLPKDWASTDFITALATIAQTPMPEVKVTRASIPAVDRTPTSGKTSERGVAIVNMASQVDKTMDTGYKWAVWDCSKYTQTVAKKATGIDIGRDTYAQMQFFRKQGLFTNDTRHLRPGDMLYFRSGGPSGRHTGVYIGNGMMLDNSGGGIKVRSIAGRDLIGIGLASQL